MPSDAPTPTAPSGSRPRRVARRLAARPSAVGHRALDRLADLSPAGRDAFLYACSTLFAGTTALVMGIPLYRQWGQLAVGPYAAATVLAGLTAWWWSRRVGEARAAAVRTVRSLRLLAFLVVFLGATVGPMALEVVWTSEGNAALHVQPEVIVVEQAGARAAHGEDPYQVIDRNGHILIHQDREPTYELYYPYLPGMVVFGFSSGSRIEARLTDARIQFLLFTTVLALLALLRLRPRSDARVRAFQVLTVLPTAALPLATGGDDMPVVALMLAGLVALHRRRPLLAGLALGAASSLKFTAWPVLVVAVWAARARDGRRSVAAYLAGAAAVLIPVVVPVALRNPSAFVDNVVRFPLGLAGVSSPAASALPGHLLVAAVPSIHRAYVVVVGVAGLAVLGRRLLTRPPVDAAQVSALTGWVMLVAILLAPATRVGYLLYPINLFVWAWMLRSTAPGGQEVGGPGGGPATEVATGGPDRDADAPPQLSSEISKSSSV